MIKKHLVERNSFDKPKVDAENQVLSDVSVLGSVSKNGYTYTENALNQALPLLEGAKVFMDHREIREDGTFKPHSIKSYVGRLEGIYKKENKLFAKTLRVVKHWEEIHPIAEKDSSAIGLSIDAIVGVDEQKEGEVQEVYHIRSADLVSDPATTKGIFESYHGDEPMKLEDLKKNHPDLVKQITDEVTKTVTESVTKTVTENLKTEEEKPNKDTALLEACSKEEVLLDSKQLKIARSLEGEVLTDYLKEVKATQENVDPLDRKKTKDVFDPTSVMTAV